MESIYSTQCHLPKSTYCEAYTWTCIGPKLWERLSLDNHLWNYKISLSKANKGQLMAKNTIRLLATIHKQNNQGPVMGTAWLHSLLAMHLYWKSYILQSHEQTWNTFTACMPDLLGNFGKELINSWFVCPTGGKLIYTCRKVVWAPMRNSIRKSSTYPNLSTRVHNTLYLIWLPWRLHSGSELCI